MTILGAFLSRAQGQPAGRVFEVQISVSPADPPVGVVLIDAVVTNRSGGSQVITAWTQEGWSWVCDNPAFRPVIDTLKNESCDVVLEPDEHRRSTVVLVEEGTKQPATGELRLGFAPNALVPLSTQTDAQGFAGIIWSNRVTLAR